MIKRFLPHPSVSTLNACRTGCVPYTSGGAAATDSTSSTEAGVRHRWWMDRRRSSRPGPPPRTSEAGADRGWQPIKDYCPSPTTCPNGGGQMKCFKSYTPNCISLGEWLGPGSEKLIRAEIMKHGPVTAVMKVAVAACMLSR